MFLCQQLPVTGDEVMTRHSGRNTPAGEQDVYKRQGLPSFRRVLETSIRMGKRM